MNSLLEHSVAQPTEYRFLKKTNWCNEIGFLLDLSSLMSQQKYDPIKKKELHTSKTSKNVPSNGPWSLRGSAVHKILL